jgi:membrane fusion protein, multidrug efflux system
MRMIRSLLISNWRGFNSLLLALFGGVALAILVPGCGRGAETQARQAPMTQVVVSEVQRKPVRETLPLVGTITANEMVEIQSETDGIVQEILFTEGEQVEKGRLLILLDESKLAAGLAEAEANLQLSEATHERNRQLFADNLISRQEYDQSSSMFTMHRATVELRQRQLRDTRIHAPFSGIVGARQISPGQVIGKNTVLTWLVDLNPVKAEFNVPERYVSRLRPGQLVEILVAAYPGRRFAGEVFFVSPHMDQSTRTAVVKANVPNPIFELRSGMFANLELILEERDDAVVIPEVGIQRLVEGNRAMVFLVNDTDTVEARLIDLGIWSKGEVEVPQGLEEGERLLVAGGQKVGPGAKVRVGPPERAAVYLGLGKGPAPAELNSGPEKKTVATEEGMETN